MGHLLFDCAWSQGSRDRQTGCLGAPWILATHQGQVGQEILSDLEAHMAPSLLSGQEPRQTRECLEVQVNPQILSHLAVLWGLEAPGALSDQEDPQGPEALAPL